MASDELSPLLLMTSPLGDDRLPVQEGTLHAVAMTVIERLSAPFNINVTAVSTVRAVDPDELLNKSVTVTVRRKDGVDREFNGVVCRFESIGSEERARWRYKLTIVPRLWLLDQSIDCRIFQQETAEQILRKLFSEHQVDPVEYRLYGDKPVRPYTTQFNETDLVFVERIMQESGYYYFFEHSGSKHKLIVADGNQAFKPQPSPLHRVIIQGDNVDILDAWSETLATAYGRVQTQDYDPEKPQRLVNGQQQSRLNTPGASSREVYRWPAMTIDNRVAADRARFQMEAAEARAALSSGHGYDPNICAGFRFTLTKDPVTGASDVEQVVESVTHSATDETWVGGTTPPRFDCSFACFKQTVTWRDDLFIPRPVMPGIFSGIVLGQPGEEIHSDHLARIKVQPKFDHRKDTTADKSIFIRILHAWAGDRWGWQHLPRVGTEVGIAFMNGDPDNPVVVGSFYHEENPPIFDVPIEETKQGFKSRSTLHGSTQEYNELSFDDKRGAEAILMHAQKDLNVEVENNRTVETQMNDSLTSKMGAITITADVGPITISSPTIITLKVDETVLILTPEGITMTGPVIAQVAEADITLTAPTITEVAEADITFETPLFLAPFPIPDLPE